MFYLIIFTFKKKKRVALWLNHQVPLIAKVKVAMAM